MLKRYSVQKLNRISKGKEIWCFGCGKRLNDISDMYGGEPFIDKISVLIDNNRTLWGVKRKVGKRQVLIQSPDILKNQVNKNVVMLITADSYQEIYRTISDDLSKAGITCSRYPVFYYTYSAILQKLCGLFPLKRQMVFHAGSEPHENAKALVEYLTNQYQGLPYDLVFVAEKEEGADESLENVLYIDKNTLTRRNSFGRNLKYCFYMATSMYIFYENEPLEKVRTGQKLVYLNHGTIPLKNVSDVLKQSENVDYALCPSEACAEIYLHQYNIPREKLIYGMPPRDDFLKKDGRNLYKLVGNREEQVIIWLPTFRRLTGTDRKDSAIDNVLPLISKEDDFREINRCLKRNNQIILIKSHPREAGQIRIPAYCDNIVLLSDKDLKKEGMVLQEILPDTAALLTDYSGISFEYLLINHPIGYVINDMESYTRGFAYKDSFKYMPGTIIYTVEDLEKFLNGVKDGRDVFCHEREKLMETLFQGNEKKSGSQELVSQLEDLNRGKVNGIGKRRKNL